RPPLSTLFPYTTLFRSEEVIVKDTLRPAGEGQTRSALAVQEFDGAAGFHDLEHGDQPIGARTLAKQILHELLLLGFAFEPLKGKDRKSTRLNSSHDQIS